MLTAPDTRIDALEGEVGIELADRLTARMDLDALVVAHECCRAQGGQDLSIPVRTAIATPAVAPLVIFRK